MARVFSAVDIEDEEVLDQLEKIRDRLDLGLSPVKKENMHLTPEFLENVDNSKLNKTKSAVSNMGVDPFNMEIQGLGAFPSEDHIRMVWAGVNSHKVFVLHKQIKLHDISSNNKHEFKPHITMLRVKNISQEQKKKLNQVIREHRDGRYVKLKADSLKLFKSLRTVKGSNYRKLIM